MGVKYSMNQLFDALYKPNNQTKDKPSIPSSLYTIYIGKF